MTRRTGAYAGGTPEVKKAKTGGYHKQTNGKGASSMAGNIILARGCKVYYRGWRNGYLWIAELYEQGGLPYVRCVDEQGRTLFRALAPHDINHVGGDHSHCAGDGVNDNDSTL